MRKEREERERVVGRRERMCRVCLKEENNKELKERGMMKIMEK